MNSYFSRIITARRLFVFYLLSYSSYFYVHFQILQVVNITEEDIHYLSTLFHALICIGM